MNETKQDHEPEDLLGELNSYRSELLKARTILCSETVTDRLARKVMAQAIALEADDPNAPITVLVNSPGGSADSGFAIYDLLKFIKPPIRTICNGLCASAGVMIYLAGDDGQRFSLPNSRFLLHQPSTFSQGQATDIEITANEILRLRGVYNQIVADITGKSVDEVTSHADRDFWLSAEAAKEYGLVDKIVASRGEID